MGETRVVSLGVLVVVCVALQPMAGCDMQSKKRLKLPPRPVPAKVDTSPRNPAAWTERGDEACPVVESRQTTGAPGTTIRRPAIARVGIEGAVACQLDGQFHGPATIIDNDGTVATGSYEFGQRTGTWVGHHVNRRLAWSGTFNADQPVGNWTYWNEAGQLVATGERAGEQRAKMWLFYDDDDETRFVTYRRGRADKEGLIVGNKPVISHAVCALGYSAPRCKSVFFGGVTFRRGADDRNDGGNENSFVLDLGLTVNVARSHGVGIQSGFYIGDEYARTALRASYRYYLHYGVAIEGSAGVIFPRGDKPIATSRGENGRLELIIADQVGLGFEVEHFDLDGDGGRKTAGFATVRVGWIPLGLAAYIVGSIGGR